MFGIGKKTKKEVTAKIAAGAYTKHCFDLLLEHHSHWAELIYDCTDKLETDYRNKIRENVEGEVGKYLLLAGFLAIDAVAIKNCFDVDVSEKLYDEINKCICSTSGDHLLNIYQYFLKTADLRLEEMSALPHEAIVYGMMEHLGFGDSAKTKLLFDDLAFVIPVSMPLIQFGAGWWKDISEHYTIVGGADPDNYLR